MKNPQETVIELFVSTDEQQWDQVKAVFDSKVLLDYSSMTGSPATSMTPDEIVDAWKGLLPGFDHTHHQLGNFQMTLSNNQAQVFCYGTASHYLENESGKLWWVVGSYNFDLVKEDETWKIAGMKFNFKYQDGNTQLPQLAMKNLKK
ncbi:nuclear transport factor 2 family protein [bacterium SCSIO 12741]|nr:nuclear transport factor 2 family protein [bacterium SCSIO 12741]